MMEENINLLNISKTFNPGFERELSRIISLRHNNRYVDFICHELNREAVDKKILFQYGIDNLPNNSSRPNMKLSTYFLILSELKDLPYEASSLAVDLMVYCENDSDGPDSLRPDLIDREYQRIKPMLA
jgi:hypothetical protein